MKLTRYNPNTSLSHVSDFDDWFRNPFAGFSGLGRFLDWDNFLAGGRMAGSLATDIHEDNNNYYARFEVPGVKREDVKIELNDRMLTVTVDKKDKAADGSTSSFSSARSISVPESVKSNEILAKLEDGILTVTLPKNEERKPRNIEVS